MNSQELYRSKHEDKVRREFVDHFHQCPIPDVDLLSNLGLFLNSKNLSRILFMDHIYRQIVEVPGIVMEFGTRWGQNLSLFAALRGIYEPFNRHRKIVGFDTFEGFPLTSIGFKDRKSTLIQYGGLACTPNYADYLTAVMEYQEADNPLAHIRKFEVCVGDVTEQLPAYLERNPETIIALAYFDLDVYQPTKVCLEIIQERLTRGSIVILDELNDHDAPGETLALMETIGLNSVWLRRWRHVSRIAYFVVRE